MLQKCSAQLHSERRVRCLGSACCTWKWFTSVQRAASEKRSRWMKKWQPWHGCRLISEQQIASHMVVRRGRVHTAPCGTPVWSAPWHEPLSIMLPNCDTVATTHVLLASASTPLQTQLPLHRRGGLLREAHQGLSEQIVLQNTLPCRAFLWGQWPERREEKKNLHHLWRRFQNEICASKGFLLKMGRLCATAKCQSGLFVFTFQRRGCRIVVLYFPQTKQTLSEWEAYECEEAPRDCDKSAHNS